MSTATDSVLPASYYGATLNPALAIAISFVSVMQTSVTAEIAFKYIWIYTVFPIIGAMCALAFYEFVFKKAREECNKPAVEEHGSEGDINDVAQPQYS